MAALEDKTCKSSFPKELNTKCAQKTESSSKKATPKIISV
jgi:hypothetical protein